MDSYLLRSAVNIQHSPPLVDFSSIFQVCQHSSLRALGDDVSRQKKKNAFSFSPRFNPPTFRNYGRPRFCPLADRRCTKFSIMGQKVPGHARGRPVLPASNNTQACRLDHQPHNSLFWLTKVNPANKTLGIDRLQAKRKKTPGIDRLQAKKGKPDHLAG